MTALRVILTVFGSAIAAAFVVAVSAMAATALAVATNSTAGVPGVVTATAGDGVELASTQFISPGSAIWFLTVTALFTAGSLVAFGLHTRRRANTGHVDQP